MITFEDVALKGVCWVWPFGMPCDHFHTHWGRFIWHIWIHWAGMHQKNIEIFVASTVSTLAI